METKLLAEGKDPMGQAIRDYFETGHAGRLRVFSPQFDEDELPVATLFRKEKCMPKFSIIVPVYNVEDYIEKCLDSICNQTFEDFEVIVVNDGTKDNSGYFIDEFAKKDKRIRSFKKRNGGLSSARNFGVKKARGVYILFVDSDDCIEKDLLKKLNAVIEKNKDLDLIRFQINEVNEYTNKSQKLDSTVFDVCSGEVGFVKLTTNSLLEPAWAYAYKSDFFKKYNFMYANGKLHEDFGLTPYIIVKAKKMCSIDYYGYNYLIRENSIMTSEFKPSRMDEEEAWRENYLYMREHYPQIENLLMIFIYRK